MCKALAMSHKEESSLYLVAWTINAPVVRAGLIGFVGAWFHGRLADKAKRDVEQCMSRSWTQYMAAGHSSVLAQFECNSWISWSTSSLS
ncbi:hypothetical protein DY000_02013063 [Brassica cretica]|uniref:Uncharacterized protein n=1 Tax=Brassica cretica TaxID=69181 RepID=A0ABQ7CRT7_BRACR|nr:hypothetical protein DY000_02013063 [Brassica cretica]